MVTAWAGRIKNLVSVSALRTAGIARSAQILPYDGHPCPSKPTRRRTRMSVVLGLHCVVAPGNADLIVTTPVCAVVLRPKSRCPSWGSGLSTLDSGLSTLDF